MAPVARQLPRARRRVRTCRRLVASSRLALRPPVSGQASYLVTLRRFHSLLMQPLLPPRRPTRPIKRHPRQLQTIWPVIRLQLRPQPSSSSSSKRMGSAQRRPFSNNRIAFRLAKICSRTARQARRLLRPPQQPQPLQQRLIIITSSSIRVRSTSRPLLLPMQITTPTTITIWPTSRPVTCTGRTCFSSTRTRTLQPCGALGSVATKWPAFSLNQV